MRDLLQQARYVVVALGVFSFALIAFVSLLLLLFVVDVHAGGHLKCDTYTTHKLARWLGVLRNACKNQPGFDKTQR